MPSPERLIGLLFAGVGAAFFVIFIFLAVRQCWWEYRHDRHQRAHGGHLHRRRP